MTNSHIVVATLSLLLSACTADGEPALVDCADEQLGMTGAFDVDTPSASTFLVNQAIIGVAGFGDFSAMTAYSFTLQNPFQGGELGTVGVYDVAANPLKYLVAPANADCQVPGACSGFVATAGTFEVLAVQPMYRATFTLDALRTFDGSNATGGAAISGKVTGCVTAVR